MLRLMLYEYLVTITPSASICLDIMKMKHQCMVDYNWHWAIKSHPHITLSNFIQPLSYENRIINRYKSLASSATPFTIYLSGFGCFPAHTIYVDLAYNEQIFEIAKNIKLFTPTIFKKIRDYRPHVVSEPHVTIAKGILEAEFYKAWPTWEKKEYRAQFMADRVQVLRRPFSEIQQKYEVIGDFPFAGLGFVNPQLKCFETKKPLYFRKAACVARRGIEPLFEE